MSPCFLQRDVNVSVCHEDHEESDWTQQISVKRFEIVLCHNIEFHLHLLFIDNEAG